MVVPVVVMVQAGEVTEVGGALVRGDGTFLVSGDGSNVVIEGGEHLVAEVIHHVRNIGLG